MDLVLTCEFRDDDDGYLAWLAANYNGYVINIARGYSPNTARIHRADCWTISRQNPARGSTWTGSYVKICAKYLVDLDQWATDTVGEAVARCGMCHPAASSSRRVRPKVTVHPPSPVPEGRWEVHGPTSEIAVVAAWTEDYVRFENEPDWQKDLRNSIRGSCRQLEPSSGQVLQATYFGDKREDADIENLALYNMHDSFAIAGRNGIRFEHGALVARAPGNRQYAFAYRYALAPSPGTFAYWQERRTLASFEWIDLGSFKGESKLSPTWLAITRGEVDLSEPTTPDTPFAVKLQIRPPRGIYPVWGGLMKSIIDGVICAFQAHTDATDLHEVARRLATRLPLGANEIEDHLLDKRTAVLGAVNRLVKRFGEAGVQWEPADHLCVASELLATEPVDDRWAIKGELVEISRRAC